MAVADATLPTPADLKGEPLDEQELFQWPYRFSMEPLDELTVDQGYQRPLTSFWHTVSEKFNPLLVGTLVVSDRARRKNVVDGQTRLTAMRERGMLTAPCLIYEGLSRKQEAKLFALLQTERRGMRTYDRFRAQLVGGEPLAVGISKLVESLGFELGANETPRTLKSIAACERMWKIDPDHLRDVLELVRDVWGVPQDGRDRDKVSAQILSGLSTFIRGQDKLDYDRLRMRLNDVTPKLLMNRAAQIREGAGVGTGAARSVAQAILQEYMRRGR